MTRQGPATHIGLLKVLKALSTVTQFIPVQAFLRQYNSTLAIKFFRNIIRGLINGLFVHYIWCGSPPKRA